MKISELDRKIIYELGKDARQSYAQIARNLNSKKPVIAYHMQKLIKDKFIWKFVPVYSLNRLGIYAHKIYCRLFGLDKTSLKKMLKAMTADPNINWVATCVGEWDLLISIYAKNIQEFAEKKQTFFDTWGSNIRDYTITLLEDALVFNRDYLVNKSLNYRTNFVFGGPSDLVQLSDKETSVLRHINNNARYNVLDISEKTGLSTQTVLKILRNLTKRDIIQGHTTFLNIEKLGLKFFKLCIYLSNASEKNYQNIVNFCKQDKNTIHIIKALGSWEIETEMEVTDNKKIHEFIAKIKAQFPQEIKKIDVIMITEELKLDFLPEWF